MIEKCPDCGGLHYRTDPCRPKLERVTPQEQVASDDSVKPARSDAPKPRKNRNEYHKFNMRRWRAKKRAEKAAALVNAVNATTSG